MRMRTLGHSGLFVSELCFGAMTFGGTDGLWGQVGRLGQGKYSGGNGGRQTELDFPPIDRDRGEPLIKSLGTVARKHGRSPAQIAIGWLLAQPVVSTVIIGAKRVEQLRENVQATEVVLDDEDIAQRDAVSRLPMEYPGWSLRCFSDREF